MTDPLAEAFHRAADETNDAHDHDELHAAASLLERDYGVGELMLDDYVHRWIIGLMHRYGISLGDRSMESHMPPEPEPEDCEQF